MRSRIAVFVLVAAILMGTATTAQSIADPPAYRPAPQGRVLDLAPAFHTRSPWRLVVTEGAEVKDYGDNDAPGALTLCLRKGAAGPCVSGLVSPPLRQTQPGGGPQWEPHYLIAASAVYPRGPQAAPFLLIVTGSLNSGDGDQAIATQLVAYDAGRDAFHRVYIKSTGRNNNEEIRFITEGPLRGSVVSAEPQDHLPYGYWIAVDRLTAAGAYRQVLSYPSATIYNDGNPLAVIDSEMPNIQRRLGLWKSGEPIPTPARNGGSHACLKPVLKHTELWCN